MTVLGPLVSALRQRGDAEYKSPIRVSAMSVGFLVMLGAFWCKSLCAQKCQKLCAIKRLKERARTVEKKRDLEDYVCAVIYERRVVERVGGQSPAREREKGCRTAPLNVPRYLSHVTRHL